MGQRARRWVVAAVAALAAVAPTLALTTTAPAAAASRIATAPRLTPAFEDAPRPLVVNLGRGRAIAAVAGHAHVCAVLASSALECWGWNFDGQLGDGTTATTTRPRLVRGLTGVTGVALGFAHTCARLRTATVACWGWNFAGQLGDRSLRSSSLPQRVLGLVGARQVTVGFAHSCALVDNGTVRCWGWNAAGQLGDGTTASQWVPVAVRGLRDVLQISAGYATTCAVLRSHRVACWGANASGELGDGARRATMRPVLVHGLSDVRSVAVGFASVCAVLLDGKVACWGKNNFGQLGDGSRRSRAIPTSVRDLAHATQVALGYGHACALLSNGTVRCWGWNGHGQLGTGDEASHLTAVPSATLGHVRSVTAGDDDTCALLAVGLVSCWGWNNEGELGDGTREQTTRPPYVPAAPRITVSSVGDERVRLSWYAPGAHGVAPITSYTATATDTTAAGRGGQRCVWRAGPLACTVVGLRNGDAYRFAVDARNVAGHGPWSAPSPLVVPATIPGSPRTVTAFAANTAAEVTWAAPISDGGRAVTRYVATATDVTTPAGSGGTCVWTTGPLACTVEGLANGDSYTFTVFARNPVGAGGAGPRSNAVIPAAVPDAPPDVVATPASEMATVTWDAASTNGSAVTGYKVTATDTTTIANGGQTCTWTAGPFTCTLTGLTNGDDYTFGVAATNAVGSGPPGLSLPVTPATVPDAPQDVVGTSGNASVVLTWSAPASTGGLPITTYTATATDTSNPGSGHPSCTSSGPLTCTVTGLTNGDAYTFTVTATSGAGTSAPSTASPPVTPATVPGAPTGVTATSGPASANVTWTAGATGGSPITGYVVTAADATTPANGHQTCSTSTLACPFTGLTDGDSYTFTVKASNAVGTGPASSPSNAVTPADVPGSPQNVSATPGTNQAKVTWTAPGSTGGDPITGYTVLASDEVDPPAGGEKCTTTGALTCTVKSLTNGDPYTFTVTATTIVGTSDPSSPSQPVTPFGDPDAPTGVTGVAQVGGATVSWNAPGNDGGSAIFDYTVTATDETNSGDAGGSCDWGGSGPLSCIVSGLTNGDTYTFTVTATNAAGTGPSSAPSSDVTLPSAPDAPSGVVGVSEIGSAVVSWNAPDTDGGSTITDYTVTASDQSNPSAGGETCDWSGGPLDCTVGGLTSGDTYTFTVTATNGVGMSPASDPSVGIVID
jgi:hypothetical protein